MISKNICGRETYALNYGWERTWYAIEKKILDLGSGAYLATFYRSDYGGLYFFGIHHISIGITKSFSRNCFENQVKPMV